MYQYWSQIWELWVGIISSMQIQISRWEWVSLMKYAMILLSISLRWSVDADVIFLILIGCRRSISVCINIGHKYGNCGLVSYHRCKYKYLVGNESPWWNMPWSYCPCPWDEVLMPMLYFLFLLDVYWNKSQISALRVGIGASMPTQISHWECVSLMK